MSRFFRIGGIYIFFLFLFLFQAQVLLGQSNGVQLLQEGEEGEEVLSELEIDIEDFFQSRDTLTDSYDFGSIVLPDPDFIRESYSYNPDTDRYYFHRAVDQYDINLPVILTREQYEDIILRAEIRKYFQMKFASMHGRLKDSVAQRDMLPRYYVNSKLFEGIFGSNTIDVKPSGSVEFDMGIRYSKQENPLSSTRNRKSMMFDFDQRISMGLQGMVGTRMSVNINYDTQSTFEFQNIMKLAYEPDPDDIVRKIEVGNVSMPLTGSLIRGAQSLFGVKAELQFGRTTITGVFSEQKSQTSSVSAQGGGAMEDFELYALDYDEDRHFFLSQYFRNNYDKALLKYPFVNSQVRITKIEVWVTNRYSRLGTTNNNARNFVALADLGEGRNINGKSNSLIALKGDEPGFFTGAGNSNNAYPDNKNNKFDPGLIPLGTGYLNSTIRTSTSGGNGFNSNVVVSDGLDYVKLESARKLSSNEFTFHPQLGYISLNQRLSNDEVLAVSFQYTVGSEVYQVGEFATDQQTQGIQQESDPSIENSQVGRAQSLVLKMLKSSFTRTSVPIWNLMMKNIYQIPNASYLSQDKFRFNIMYSDPSMLNYISSVTSDPLPEGVERKPLLHVFHLDRLNYTLDPQEGGDGFFDFLPNGNLQGVFDPSNPSSNTGFGNSNFNNTSGNNTSGNGSNFGSGLPGQSNNGGYGSGGYGSGGYGSGGYDRNNSLNEFQGLTIDAVNGRVIFTSVEPFGEYLFDKLKSSSDINQDYDSPGQGNANQEHYVFRELYSSTKSAALRNSSNKNKFVLKGKFSSEMGEGIPIGAYNVAPGSVVVKTAGRVLVEGLDYTVDYSRGRVMILDPSLQNSNTPIEVSVENNSMFGQQTKQFFGFHIDHKISEDFIIGGTFLRLAEKPMTHKSSYGMEPVNNTIWGFNFQYSTEVPFLTRLVNKLPNIDTDVESRLSLRGEFAYLQPGSPSYDQMNGEATTYIDDFEAAQSTIDIKSPLAWKLSSVPLGYFSQYSNDKEQIPPALYSLEDGFKRSKLAWYTIDPVFYVGSRPSDVTQFDLDLNASRRVYNEELFPDRDIAYGESTVINTLDLSFYPQERGPYNFNKKYLGSTTSSTPQENWGGIMRGLNTTNFEQANIEMVEFWLMDPFYVRPGESDPNVGEGELKINFGLISEDVLRDGLKQYENGLPISGDINEMTVLKSIWGQVPAAPSLIYAFDINEQNRLMQDVGLDGLSDEQERLIFNEFSNFADPANDNFVHYLADNAGIGILQRYKNYNGTDKNSPTGTMAGNNQPDTEDVDGDNTMNTIDSYMEYSVKINRNIKETDPYVASIREGQYTKADGKIGHARWIQFKVPIDKSGLPKGSLATSGQDNLEDMMRSMRFMRMYLTGFDKAVTLRFGTLNLVRSDWRKSDRNLKRKEDFSDKENDPEEPNNTAFEATTVNIIDNADRQPIPYVTPPGVKREQLYLNSTLINENEQSLSLRVYPKEKFSSGGLGYLDARAVYKTFRLDMRQYKKLRMFIHAENIEDTGTSPLQDGDAIAFIRLGSDVTDNYYQIEIPLKVTAANETNPMAIWPEVNELDLPIELLSKLKLERTKGGDISKIYPENLPIRPTEMQISMKGNPSFANVRIMMLGVRNTRSTPFSGEFWFDELRLSDMENKGGWAATVSMDANLADFATVSATAMKSTVGFGGLEQGPWQRSKEDYQSYSVVTNVNLGHLLPQNWGVVLPMNYGISEEVITPEYDPVSLDLKLSDVKMYTNSSAEAEEIERRALDYTKRKSINFIGVSKQRMTEKKPTPIDVENLTLSHSYNEVIHHDFEIEGAIDQQVRSSLDYNYSFGGKSIEPFKNIGAFSNRYFALIKDFNFNLVPSNITFSTNVLRQYNRQQFRMIDVQGIGLDPLYRRNYFFNYNYGFNLDLTRSLRITYLGGSNNTVKNYYDTMSGMIDNSNTIWDDYFNIGEPNQFTQSIDVTYDLPLNKLPFLSFIRSSFSYNGTYNWQKSSESFSYIELDDISYNLGNTIQNARTQQLNTTFNMDEFYRYIGLVKSSRKAPTNSNVARKAAIVPGQKVVQKSNSEDPSVARGALDVLIGLVTSVKNVQINYSENSGTLLPGYLPSIGFFGSAKPGLGFVLGYQDDIRQEMAGKGYLTDFPNLSQPYQKVDNTTLNIAATVEPFRDLLIDVTAMRLKSNNESEQFNVVDNIYQSMVPYGYGNYSISTVMIGTAFSNSSVDYSALFEQMKSNRIIVANRLAIAQGIDIGNPVNLDKNGFPIGYSQNSQAVLLPSFVAAYSGKDANGVSTGMFKSLPLPNWNIRYNGLMKLEMIKKYFRRFSISHGYTSSYNLGSFSTNLKYGKPIEAGEDIPGKHILNNATLYEMFNPLIRFDMETKSAIRILAEMRKERMLSLSFDNSSVSETYGNDFVVGLGYRVKDVGFTSSYANNGMGGRIQSDINIKADLTLSKRETVVRYLDYQNNQIGGGQDMWSLRLTADYMLSENLTAIFYYDHSFSKAVISTMYPVTNIRSGITIRYNFGN